MTLSVPRAQRNQSEDVPKTFLRRCILGSLFATFAASSSAEDASPMWSSDAMLAAGADALARELPQVASQFELNAAAHAAFEAMWPYQRQPIETAPKTRMILLGLAGEDGLRIAIGRWEVHDEPPFDGGRWTATVWWGAVPTHWMAVPPLPEQAPSVESDRQAIQP